MEAVFNPKTNEHASWPATDPRELFAQFANRPTLAIQMALELSTIILEIEDAGGVLLEKEAYAHQLGQLKWLALSLLEGGTSYMIEGAPGSGKTLVLGAIMMAATRLQMRGLMDSAVIFGTHRPYILAQQTFNPEERRTRLIENPRIADIRQEVGYCVKVLGEEAEQFFTQEMWRTLRLRRYPHREAAVAALSEGVLEKEGGDKFIAEKKDLLPDVARLLTSEAVLVYDIDDSIMMLPLSPAPVTDDESVSSYGGDIGRGIPAYYLKEGFVAARKGVDAEGNAIGPNKKGVAARSLENVRVLLTTAPSVTMRGYRTSILDVLRRTGIVIVDEGREAATRFQDAIKEASEGNASEPLVFIASALSTTNGLGSRPYADRYSPRLTIEEAMEPGLDGKQVLPNVGVDMFPGNGSVLYDSETTEALQQLVQAHFTQFPLPDKVELPQPHMCTSLIVVSNDNIAEAVLQLRQEYAKRGIDADVIPFRNRVSKSDDGNNKPPYSERVLQAMMDDHSNEDGKKRVRIMVASPDTVKDALSIPTLQNVTVGTAKGITRNVLLRIFGRLQHSNRHHTAGPAHRGYFRQGLYQNTKIDETIFQLLGGHEGDSVRWVPLQILKGDRAAAEDRERVEGVPAVNIPLSGKGLHSRIHQKGTNVRQAELLRLHAQEAVSRPPRYIAANRILASKQWDLLVRIGRNLLSDWSDKETWEAFMEIALEKIQEIAPAFMCERDVWLVWASELTLEMSRHRADGPQVLVDALRHRIVKAARMGHVEDDVEVAIVPLEEEDDEETEEDEQEDELKPEEEPDIDGDDAGVAEEVEHLDSLIADLDDDDDAENYHSEDGEDFDDVDDEEYDI